MPNYHYRCQKCTGEFQIQQSIKEDSLKHCDECNEDTLERVIHCVDVIDATPRTVGGLADYNARQMGHCEVDDRRHKILESKGKAKKEFVGMPKGMTSARPEKKVKMPWKSKHSIQKLASLTDVQKKKYIEEGKV